MLSLFSMNGRMRRRSFGFVLLCGLLLRVVPTLTYNILHQNFGVQYSDAFSTVFFFTMLAILIGTFIVVFTSTTKRLNDIEKPWWLVLLLFVPLVNLGLILYLLFTPGIIGNNEHGEDPKRVVTSAA
jgi:uncharacterized membrane protein YhaH (DUF805 family)